MILTHSEDCRKICKSLSSAPFVAVDTEFMRESSYWPRLCLVQLARSPQEAYVLDPLSGMNLDPLFELLENPRVLKIFHGGRQDVEIFYHLNKTIPNPLFDTQIAAMTCGFGDSVSYEVLVQKLAGQKIDKGQRTTDWSQRPLKKEQIAYATQDVTHLCTVYERLAERLKHNGRASWIAEELANLQNPAAYTFAPKEAWKRLHIRSNITARTFSLLTSLAAFRETLAQEQDVPRGAIFKDEAIHEIASIKPTTPQECDTLRFTPRRKARKLVSLGLLKAVASGLKKPHPSPPPRTNTPSSPMLGLLKILLTLCCEEFQVARKLVANTQLLEKLATEDDPKNPLLHGWRWDVFGRHALALKKQKIALGLQNGKPCIIPIADPATIDDSTPPPKPQ